jgi:hypothetical protein
MKALATAGVPPDSFEASLRSPMCFRDAAVRFKSPLTNQW